MRKFATGERVNRGAPLPLGVYFRNLLMDVTGICWSGSNLGSSAVVCRGPAIPWFPIQKQGFIDYFGPLPSVGSVPSPTA